jgi:AcrR family transcriptional regulator
MVRGEKASKQMRAQSRAQILAAARKLFAENGYFNTKVADIAQEASMSQGNLYWYFPSKEDVLKAVLSSGFEHVEDLLKQAARMPGDALHKLDWLLEQYLAFAQEQGQFLAIFLSLLGHGGVPLMHQLGFDTVQIGMRYHQHLSDLLAQARAEGVVADIDPNFLAVFYFSFFNGLLLTYREDWTMVPPEQIHQAVLRMLGYHGDSS